MPKECTSATKMRTPEMLQLSCPLHALRVLADSPNKDRPGHTDTSPLALLILKPARPRAQGRQRLLQARQQRAEYCCPPRLTSPPRSPHLPASTQPTCSSPLPTGPARPLAAFQPYCRVCCWRHAMPQHRLRTRRVARGILRRGVCGRGRPQPISTLPRGMREGC